MGELDEARDDLVRRFLDHDAGGWVHERMLPDVPITEEEAQLMTDHYDEIGEITPEQWQACLDRRPSTDEGTAPPTRHDVQTAIHDAYVSDVEPPSFLTTESMWKLTDAVMALLSRSAAGPSEETTDA